MRYLPLALFLLCACAPGKFSHIERFRHTNYRVLIDDDDARVARHCRKICPRADDGGPLDYDPPCCYAPPKREGGLGTMWTSRAYYLWCREHEQAHAENRDDAAKTMYPRRP